MEKILYLRKLWVLYNIISVYLCVQLHFSAVIIVLYILNIILLLYHVNFSVNGQIYLPDQQVTRTTHNI